ncbi:hypothetical protein GZL_08432 [Streptomyces sp. 769]|nr:hypothetical protein GZL_08432 [Streptomyces sp. 769]
MHFAARPHFLEVRRNVVDRSSIDCIEVLDVEVETSTLSSLGKDCASWLGRP